LSKAFNRDDFKGLALLDERYGLCLKARPPKTRRQYETLAFWMARHRQQKKLLDEEMRILYVALTRAQHRLLLVGSPSKKAREDWRGGGKRPAAANCLLDWIGPWLTANCPTLVETESGEANDWLWNWHTTVETADTKATAVAVKEVSPEALAELKQRIDWNYPFKPATQQEAKSSATALRRAVADEPELARPVMKTKRGKKSEIAASQLGQAAHRFMQHAKFETFGDIKTLRNEVQRVRDAGVLTAEEAKAIEGEKILAFWQSDFGRELLQHADRLERELVFTAKFSRADLRAVGAPLNAEFADDEFIVVQGAADLVAILDDELWLVDFKTDRIPEALLAARVEEYSLQLRIYALALSRIYGRPVTRACLHFLELGRTEWLGSNTKPSQKIPPPKKQNAASAPGPKQLTLFSPDISR
jgi:ATP-dependent helicase/nuclease subunit A